MIRLFKYKGFFSKFYFFSQGDFAALRENIKHVREEAVAKETLANQKIQELEMKLTRDIREAVPTTTRDEGEFTPSQTKSRPTKTKTEKVAHLLEEVKTKVESGTRFKARLDLAILASSRQKEVSGTKEHCGTKNRRIQTESCSRRGTEIIYR